MSLGPRFRWAAATTAVLWGVIVGGPAASASKPAHALISDPAGDTPYSFNAQADITSVEITWTDELAVRIGYREAPPTADLHLLVSAAARDELDSDDLRCDPDLDDSFAIDANRDGATFQDPSIEGSLTAAPVWDGAGAIVTYAFKSPMLVRRFTTDRGNPFVCVDGTADQDTFYGAFDGKVLKLTARTATEGVRGELDRRFAAGRKSSTRVRCLSRGKRARSEPDGDYPGQDAQRSCAYHVVISRRTVGFGEASISLSHGSPRTVYFYVKRLPTGSRECGTTDFSGRWLLAPFPESFGGASMSVWAKRASCRTARRVAGRGRQASSAYRCKTIRTGWEYRAVRCDASGGRRIWIDSGS